MVEKWPFMSGKFWAYLMYRELFKMPKYHKIETSFSMLNSTFMFFGCGGSPSKNAQPYVYSIY
jgi:hypothetical protein